MARQISAENVEHDAKELLALLADDVVELRTKLVAVLAKLDADAGVTDVNYASLHTPAASNVTR